MKVVGFQYLQALNPAYNSHHAHQNLSETSWALLLITPHPWSFLDRIFQTLVRQQGSRFTEHLGRNGCSRCYYMAVRKDDTRDFSHHAKAVGLSAANGFGIRDKKDAPQTVVACCEYGWSSTATIEDCLSSPGKSPFTRISLVMIGEGQNYGFYVPSALYKDEPHNLDVDVTLHYQGYGKTELTVSRAYRIELLNGSVYHIKRGIHEWWGVSCPTCDAKFIMMNTDGLENYDAAYKREAQLKEQLKATCPQHQSLLMDTIETINERRKKEKEKGIYE
jgi:hypothetical protein